MGESYMIYLYSGTPGSGKSYHALVTIYRNAKRGRPVLCNFPVNYQGVDCIENLTVSSIVSWAVQHQPAKYREGYDLLVIDEAQLFLNARAWTARDRSEWNTFFSQHRKLCFDIILIAQSDILIDKQVRILIEYEYVHRKALGVYDLPVGKIMICEKYWYGRTERVGTLWLFGRKKIYQMYDTTALFGALAFGGGNPSEQDIKQQPSVT